MCFYSYYNSKICTQQHYYNFPLLEGIFGSCCEAKKAKVNKIITINTTAIFFLSLKPTPSDTYDNRLPLNT